MAETKTDAEKAKEKAEAEKAAAEAEKRREANEKEAASLKDTVEEVAAKHKTFVDKVREGK